MKTRSPRCTLLLAALSFVLLTGADWRRFRGPGGDGVSEEKGLPLTWSATENVVWKTPLPGFGASSPITLGEKIFLTAYSGYGLDEDRPGQQEELVLHVLCLDRGSGEILWDKTSKARTPVANYGGGQVNLHGYASGTPVTDGEAVYAFFGRSGVKAYSIDGELLWEKTVGDGTHSWGSGTSPIVAGDLLIVNASVESESLVALDKTTGGEVWRVGGITRSWSTPLLVESDGGDGDVIVSLERSVLGLDPATGEQRWRCAGIDSYLCPMPIVHDGIAYVTGGRPANTLAVRLGGRGDVTDTHLLWKSNRGSIVPSPVYHEGLLYCVSESGIASCVEADSGEQVYGQRIDIPGDAEKVYASMVLADERLYVVTRQAGTLVLAPGRELKELARNDLGDDSIFNATPVVSNGQLLLRSDRFLYCIGE